MKVDQELALFVFFAVASPLIDFWLYPRFMRATAAGRPGVRGRFYAAGILLQWAFTALLLILWAVRHRPLATLGLGFSSPWRLAAGGVFFVAYMILALKQRRALLARPERMRKIITPRLEALLPHTLGELLGFSCLSVTAGFCEELLFRGFFTWYLSLWCPLPLAMAASSILFGLQHLYLGIKHVGRTSVMGGVFALIVVASGSLWPAILIHAAADLVSGELGYRALSGGSRPASE